MLLHSVFETQKAPVSSTKPSSPHKLPMSSSVPSSKPQPLRSFVFASFKRPLEYSSSATASNHHRRSCSVLSESTPDSEPGVTTGLPFVGFSERLIVKEAAKISEKKSPNSGRVLVKQGDKSKAPDPRPKIYIRLPNKNKATAAAAADGAAKTTEQITSAVPAEVKELQPKPWNLRPKKPSPKGLDDDGGTQRPAQETKTQHPVRASARARKGTKSKVSEEIPRLCIALSKEEIEKDIFILTGSKPARRPKKRAKTVQKQLDSVFPGLGLSFITPELYNNVNVAPKKV